jgi:hypothetical protein
MKRVGLNTIWYDTLWRCLPPARLKTLANYRRFPPNFTCPTQAKTSAVPDDCVSPHSFFARLYAAEVAVKRQIRRSNLQRQTSGAIPCCRQTTAPSYCSPEVSTSVFAMRLNSPFTDWTTRPKPSPRVDAESPRVSPNTMVTFCRDLGKLIEEADT